MTTPPGMWKLVVDAMPQLVWLADADGRVWYYNDQVRRYCGISQAADGSWSWSPTLHDDDLERTAEVWRAAVDASVPYECEHRVRMADGSFRWHISRALPVRSDDAPDITWFGTATDIHDRAQAEEAARASEARLSQVINGLFTFVGLCTPDGILVEANESALTAAGLVREDVVGRPFWDAYWWNHDTGVQQQLQDAIHRARAGERSRYDVEVRVAGDQRVTIDFQIVPIVEDGHVVALVPSALDVSERIAEHHRLQMLATLSHDLNGAVSTAEVARLVVDQADSIVGADIVNVALLDQHELSLRLLLPLCDADLHERWGELPLDGAQTPIHDALRTGETQFVDMEQRVLRYPDTVADAERAGVVTSAALPLVDSTGHVFGVAAFGWQSTRQLDTSLRVRLRLLVELCSQALQRARRSEARDSLVRELQDEVLASQDITSALDLAVAYEPAQTELGFGGDWYDVIVVDEHQTVVVVGDVAGHGIAAAARMTATKATIRGMALTAPSRAEVIPYANRALEHLVSGYIATICLAWIDTEADEVEWRLAGHPPPVLRTPDRGTRLLAGVHHPPLGTPTEGRDIAAQPFPSGSVLVLYTDGLIERRGADIDERLEVLRRLVDSLPEDATAADIRDRLVSELIDADTADDVAIAVIRNP